MNRFEKPLTLLVDGKTEAQRAPEVWSRPHSVGAKASSRSSLSCSLRPPVGSGTGVEARGGLLGEELLTSGCGQPGGRTSSSLFYLFLSINSPFPGVPPLHTHWSTFLTRFDSTSAPEQLGGEGVIPGN